jgi:glycosyltransferase involved in cell wall biosynthesis
MKGPIRVLEVLEATEGGTRRHLVDVVEHLDPARFTVSVACSTRRDPGFLEDLRRLEGRGIRIHILPMHRSVRPVADVLAFQRLMRLLRRERFDVVHTHSSKAGFLGRVAARLAGVPRVIHTPHTFPFQMAVNPFARFCYLQLERFAARFCDRMVCVCSGQRETAVSLVGPARVAVVENGIDRLAPPDAAAREDCRRRLGLRPGDLVAGVVGRFTSQKGQLDFVEAARHVAAGAARARFMLVGDGELRRPIESAIEAAGLGDRFVLIGSRADVSDVLPAFDVLVLPSLWEGLPYVLLEGLRAGRAVVATRTGGMADALRDGVNGLLVPPGDPAALAAAMLKLLENDTLRSMMGEHARETVASRYRMEDMMAALAALYEGQ